MSALGDIRTFTLKFAGERPPTVNAERNSGHWTSGAKKTRDWRTRAYVQAKADRLPRLLCVEVEAIPHHRDRRSPQDAGACAPAVKAVVDGLVDAGVIEDDAPQFVRRLVFWAPQVDGWDGLEVIVREMP